jgi:TRAP-type transport system small permease protein
MGLANSPLYDVKAGPPALRVSNMAGLVIDYAAIAISVGSIVVIFLALMAEVVVRYFTSAGLGWPNEVPNLLFPWLIMGGIVIGAQRGSHIAAEAIRGFLSTEQLRKLLMLLHVMVAVAFSYLAWLSLQVIVITKAQFFPMTGLGQAWAYSALLFGFGGIALASLINIVRVASAQDPQSLNQSDPEHAP